MKYAEKMKLLLKTELKGFGLNPDEWILDEMDSELITHKTKSFETGILKNIWIRNFQDKNFKFKGEASFEKNNNSFKADWIRLQFDPAV